MKAGNLSSLQISIVFCPLGMLCEETEGQKTQEVVQGTYKEVFYFTFFIAVRKYSSQKQLGEGMGHN